MVGHELLNMDLMDKCQSTTLVKEHSYNNFMRLLTNLYDCSSLACFWNLLMLY